MALKSVEEKIREARERGDFDNLKGRYKPLDHSEYFRRPEAMRTAYSLLDNSGFVPPEVELQREVGELRERLAETADPKERGRLQREIERRRIKIEVLLRSYR